MNLFGGWTSRFRKHSLRAAPLSDERLEAVPASGLDALQTRLTRWSRVWAPEGGSEAQTEVERLVEERLTRWLERCFGQDVQNSLRNKGEQISLASSTPIFTAFLGRRATRELSRSVLRDV
jgi:hypothetical protein